MWKHIIYLCFLSVALGNFIPSQDTFQRDFGREELQEPNNIIELEKEFAECKKRLTQYEASSCLAFKNSSDIYRIHVPDIEPFAVYCESDIENGGWTVIQRRLDGNVSFQRSWYDYRNGFGDLKGEFFIGLEKLHKLTKSKPQELYIYIEKLDYRTSNYWFNDFIIGSEEEGYMLKSVKNKEYSEYSEYWSIGSKFTTFDRDNDKYWWGNCAKEFGGGWWFGSCDKDFEKNSFVGVNNLNGPYKDIFWHLGRYIKSVQMMIRPQGG